MKSTKAVTLISLVVTIIVLLILASIATYSGKGIVESGKLTSFTTQLKIMQTQINKIYQKYIDGEEVKCNNTTYEGDAILNIESNTTSEIRNQKDKIFQELASDSEAKIYIEEKEQYKYWSNDLIKQLGIEGIEDDFFINIQKRSIISFKGLKYKDKMYYTINQLPDSLYNVEYEGTNT